MCTDVVTTDGPGAVAPARLCVLPTALVADLVTAHCRAVSGAAGGVLTTSTVTVAVTAPGCGWHAVTRAAQDRLTHITLLVVVADIQLGPVRGGSPRATGCVSGGQSTGHPDVHSTAQHSTRSHRKPVQTPHRQEAPCTSPQALMRRLTCSQGRPCPRDHRSHHQRHRCSPAPWWRQSGTRWPQQW